MFNPNFSQYQKEMFHKTQSTIQDKIKKQEWNDFYYSSNHKFNQIVSSALNSMKSRKMITYYTLVKYHKDGQYHVSSPEEAERIKAGEQYVLSRDFHLEPNQMYELFKNDSWLDYRHACEKFVSDYMNWDDYFWIYQIWLYPTELIREEYKKFPPSLTIDQLYKQYSLELNELVCDYFLTKQIKDTEKKKRQDYLTDYFINIPNYLTAHNETFEHYKANWIWFGAPPKS